MRAMLGMTIGAVLALTAGVAVADEVTGTISNIDLTRNTFVLEGKTFTASPSNTVGDKFGRLEGRRQGERGCRGHRAGKQPINAMAIKKAE